MSGQAWEMFRAWVGPERPITAIVLILWLPSVILLRRILGPSRASLVAILGGMLFLPRIGFPVGPIDFDKRSATALGLVLGVIIFDFGSVRRPRPRWFDLPMALYVLIPLLGMGFGPPGAGRDLVHSIGQRLTGWAIPYAIGRLYFGDPDGPRRIAVGVVLAGLVYVPVCLYEEVAGPVRYLSVVIYGTRYYEMMVHRLGGNRPEGFMDNGIQLATWMALASVTAVWLWIGRSYRPTRIPIWAIAPALIATTISCRGSYGIVTLALGIGAALVTRGLRTRAVLLALAVLPSSYMIVRGLGLWDGRALVDAADLVGRGGSVAYRLKAEDQLIDRVFEGHPFVGFGTYTWHAIDPPPILDGQWLQLLWGNGLPGLVIAIVALYGLPTLRSIAHPRRRPSPVEAASRSGRSLAGPPSLSSTCSTTTAPSRRRP